MVAYEKGYLQGLVARLTALTWFLEDNLKEPFEDSLQEVLVAMSHPTAKGTSFSWCM